MKKSGSGFTIVELLIVVVVIAILAAITIVSYNGITERAKNTELLARIDSYTKALKLYQAQNGAYPGVVAAEAGNLSVACLGAAADFLASSPFAAGNCATQGGTVMNTSSTLMSQLRSVASGLPSGALPSIALSSTDNYRGIMYTGNGTNVGTITYVVSGDKDCARGVKNYISANNLTVCAIGL